MNPNTPIDDAQDEAVVMPPVDPGVIGVGQDSDDTDASTSTQISSAPPSAMQHDPIAPVAPVTGTPMQAEDVDLIEKEWVEKAKEIVERTQGDPYTQSKQLNQVKADYIRKRYNRDIKIDE